MKYLIFPVLVTIATISSCKSPATNNEQDAPANQVALFDEQSNNIVKEIKSFGGNLYVYGQHFSKENDGADYNSTLVIMDTSLKKLSERNYGGGKEDKKEFFKSFEVDDKGNTWFAGEKNGKPVVQKCNAPGEITWRKEYNLVNASSFEKILRDGDFFYLLSTGDGAVNMGMQTTQVTRIDTSGNIVWTVTAGEFSPLFGLQLLEGKLILMAPVLNFSIDNSMHMRIVCISREGKYEWGRNFTSNDSKIRLGTKLINSKASRDQKTVLFFYNSSNQFVPDFGLASVDTAGTIKILLSQQVGEIPECNNDSAIFLCYDLYSTRPGRAYAKIMVTDKNEFCQVYNYEYDLLDYTIINNTKYFIGNVQNHEKYYSHWIVRK